MPILLAEHYVHHLSPFVPFLQFGETFGVRWYGLGYVASFVVGWWLLRWLVRKGCCELREEKVADFITLVAVFGVMLGGRLGYMLIYNRESFFDNPLIFFRLLDGGMASHGGIFGVVLVTFIYASRAKISWPGLGDNLVTVSSIGICFVRIANFINGELYGRITNVSWAVKFPSELSDRNFFQIEEVTRIAGECTTADPALEPAFSQILSTSQSLRFDLVKFLEVASRKSEAVRDVLAQYLNARHPSQLYEAALEGLVPFIILLAVRLRWKNAYHGIITGLFFLLYAAGRTSMETLREPDAELVPLLGIDFTKGQFYSLFMFLIGAGFIAYGLITKRQNHLPAK